MTITAEQVARALAKCVEGGVDRQTIQRFTEALSPRLATIRAEASAAAYGAAAALAWTGDEPEEPFDDWGYQKADTGERHAAMVRDRSAWTLAQSIIALTPADATAWLAADRAVQFKAGQDAALKGAVKGWAVLGRDGAIIGTETLEPDAVYYDLAKDRGQTIRPCLILVGEGE